MTEGAARVENKGACWEGAAEIDQCGEVIGGDIVAVFWDEGAVQVRVKCGKERCRRGFALCHDVTGG